MGEMKLGSLFDGSGGFPLAACLCGMTPVWASEIEPYPIAVTRSRFPEMKHLGNISTINGAEIEPVDVITFGSPCQDLSVAGKRAGLKHEANGDTETTRSGLFMEAIRIITEMREATNGVYPRFAVWENVPGAFSSNKGRDFRIVLEEFIKIVEPEAVMPDVPSKGWPRADCYRGNGWSLAYRTLDAQYWGVPQRRRRIYLVADFTGQSAGKILFEREGLRGYSAEGRTPWETVAGNFAPCAGATGFDGYNCCLTDDTSATVAPENHPTAVCYGIGRDAFNQGRNAKFTPTFEMELQPTLVARGPGAVQIGYTVRRLTPTECARLQGFPDRWGDVDAKSNLTDEEYRFWLDVRNTHAAINGKTIKEYTEKQMLVWYNKLHTDSAEYKMWGNGIALPTALYVMQGIGDCLHGK